MLIVAGPVGEDTHLVHGHPERATRITAVRQGIEDLRLGSDAVEVPPAPAPRAALLRVHDAAYLDELQRFCGTGAGALDADTYARPDSWHAALLAAGAGLAALDALRERGEGVAFAVARPPGHHAERGRGMGFCLLNNVAVAAAELVAEGQRVAVLDWDVHHGNGTQEIFWEDPAVFYASTHQWPLYPGTGRPAEVGGEHALGTTLNVPVPPGATGDVLRLAWEEVVAPAVEAFAPDWVLVSCGFDAHRADPLAQLALSSADFGALATTAARLAPAPGRVVLFLEGGYDLAAVRRSTAATLGALVGAGPGPEAPTAGGPGAEPVLAAAAVRDRALEGGAHLEEGGLDAPFTRGGGGRRRW